MEKVRDILYCFAFLMSILVVGAIEGANNETAIPVIAITGLLTICFVLAAELMRLKINFNQYQKRVKRKPVYEIGRTYRKAYNQEEKDF